MPDITVPVSFSAEQKQVISAMLANRQFNFSHWGDEELLPIRTHIRDYYRNISGTCFYCRKDVSLRSALNAHIEHIIPKSIAREFMFEPKNMCVVCSDCNEIKREQEVQREDVNPLKRKRAYRRYPSSSNSFKVVHPHFDNYEEHIFKCGDFYIDLSIKGSFTMLICKLNRKAHKFGIEPMLLSQSQLFDLMNEIMKENNFTRQNILLSRLREYFISTSV